MPRIVKHSERRQSIAEAVWSIVARQGLRGATMRSISEECGMSVGSIQHYFINQDEIYRFSMNLMVERASNRIDTLGKAEPQNSSSSCEVAIDILKQLLPLDDERRTEAQTWLVFSAEAVANESLRDLQEKMGELIRGVCRNCLLYLINEEAIAAGVDLAFESERLYALIDGLALHLLFQSDPADGKWIDELLHGHITSLATQFCSA